MWKYQELLNQNLQILIAIGVGLLTVLLGALDQKVSCGTSQPYHQSSALGPPGRAYALFDVSGLYSYPVRSLGRKTFTLSTRSSSIYCSRLRFFSR